MPAIDRFDFSDEETSLGIDPATIGYHFSKVATGLTRASDRTVPDIEKRILATPAGAEWARDNGYVGPCATGMRRDPFVWADHYAKVPREAVLAAFDEEEVARLWLAQGLLSDLGTHFETNHRLLEHLRLSHHWYGNGQDWNLFVEHLDGLRRIPRDVAGLSVRITHTRPWNEYGPATHLRLLPCREPYLDGCFGLLFYLDARHVLTAGFSLSNAGVLVAQAQLREKRGNRFLFRLPGHYLDLVLNVLATAFRAPLWLVQGPSSVTAVRRTHNDPKGVSQEAESRMLALYGRPLAGYVRTGQTNVRRGRTFELLAFRDEEP